MEKYKDIEDKDLFFMYKSADKKEDLLRQLDELKAKQQQLIADRIKILQKRMKLQGIAFDASLQSEANANNKNSLEKEFNKKVQKNNSKIKILSDNQFNNSTIREYISTTNAIVPHDFLVLVKSYIANGKASLALSKLNKYKEEGKNSAEYHFLTGRAYQDLKLNTAAIESYSIAIYFNPKNYKYWINRGLVKGALGDKRGALNDLSESILLKKSEIAYLNRGVTFAALNNITQAMSDLNSAIKINPSYSQAYRNRGIIFRHKGDIASACKDWQTAMMKGDLEMKSWISAYCRKK